MVWKISFIDEMYHLHYIFIEADSLDEAMEIARSIDKRFNTGQVFKKKGGNNETS